MVEESKRPFFISLPDFEEAIKELEEENKAFNAAVDAIPWDNWEPKLLPQVLDMPYGFVNPFKKENHHEY